MEQDAIDLVRAERIRQVTEEGYSLTHDDELTRGQLAVLAAGYALSSRTVIGGGLYDDLVRAVQGMGWNIKPKDPIRDLTRAGALILAEIDRRLRAGASENTRLPDSPGPKE